MESTDLEEDEDLNEYDGVSQRDGKQKYGRKTEGSEMLDELKEQRN